MNFDKMEFKRNLAGSGAYAPLSTVAENSFLVVFCVLTKIVDHGSCQGNAMPALAHWQHAVAYLVTPGMCSVGQPAPHCTAASA